MRPDFYYSPEAESATFIAILSASLSFLVLVSSILETLSRNNTRLMRLFLLIVLQCSLVKHNISWEDSHDKVMCGNPFASYSLRII